MRTLILSLLLFYMDIAGAQVLQGTSTQLISSSGGTVTLANYAITTQINLTTNGSVTLSGNYTLQYTSLPSVGAHWTVYCDFSNLTAGSYSVSIFNKTPLTDWSGTNKFYINFWVANNGSGSPTLYSYYSSNLVQFGSVTNPVTFSGAVNFNTSQVKLGSVPVISNGTNDTLVGRNGDSLGVYVRCAPWTLCLNTGIGYTGRLGTTDTNSLRIFVDNAFSGTIDYNLVNTAFGYEALQKNTSGTDNVALGAFALINNTSGSINTGIGVSANGNVTTGAGNTAVGESSNTNTTTGNYNTAIGSSSGAVTSSTSYATVVGYNSQAYNYGVCLGSGGTASANQLAAANIRSLYFPYMTSAINNVLADSTGSGNFICKPISALFGKTDFVNVTGDSISPTTFTNLEKPAGTLANLTLRLPGSPYDGQIMEFTTSQTLTTLHWSTALNQSNSVQANVPTTLSIGGTIKIVYDLASTTWFNW